MLLLLLWENNFFSHIWKFGNTPPLIKIQKAKYLLLLIEKESLWEISIIFFNSSRSAAPSSTLDSHPVLCFSSSYHSCWRKKRVMSGLMPNVSGKGNEGSLLSFFCVVAFVLSKFMKNSSQLNALTFELFSFLSNQFFPPASSAKSHDF